MCATLFFTVEKIRLKMMFDYLKENLTILIFLF